MADVRAVVYPDDRDRFDANLRACLDGGTGYRSEFRIVRPDGSVRWLEEVGTLSRDAEGRPARLTGVARDVTDRREAEAALEESESRLRLALAAARAGVWSWDVPTGAVTWSPETYALFGLDPAAGTITYANWDASIYLEDRDRAIAAVRDALERRTPECRMEYRVVHPAAGVRWLMGLGRVDFADDGTPLRMSGINLDITDRKRSELALEAHERELQSLADNVPDILVRFDRELRHNFVNAAVEAPSGRPRAEFLGKTHRDLGIPEDCCELWDGAIRSVFETGEAHTLEFTYPTTDGERHYSARLIPEPGPDGRVERVLGIVHDVTDRMRYEEVLRDQDRRKDEFLATLAHELRNPLAPLRSGLEILRLGTDAEAGEEVREMMGRQLAHLIRLVDDLLDVSRIRRGRIELEAGPRPHPGGHRACRRGQPPAHRRGRASADDRHPRRARLARRRPHAAGPGRGQPPE